MHATRVRGTVTRMSRGWLLGLAGFGVLTIVAGVAAVLVFVRNLDDDVMEGFARGFARELAGHDPERFLHDREALGSTALHIEVDRSAPVPPPVPHLELIRYVAPLGPQSAYATPIRRGARRPAVVYVQGGFDWGLGDVWSPQPFDDDQSGAAFQRDDLVVMYPSLRGSHDNPGHNECFLGEVDDLLAASDHLAARPDVDPARIYLVGHSTGGTLALLVAAARSHYAGVFAFGPSATADYGEAGCFPEGLPELELKVRSPIDYVDVVRTPTWVLEGIDGNADSIEWMREHVADAPVRFLVVPDFDHFTILRTGTDLLAEAIARPGRRRSMDRDDARRAVERAGRGRAGRARRRGVRATVPRGSPSDGNVPPSSSDPLERQRASDQANQPGGPRYVSDAYVLTGSDGQVAPTCR